jgi:hypothetical protein
MPKVTKKAPVKKSSSKKTVKKTSRQPVTARTRTATATPRRVVTRGRGTKSEAASVSRSATKADIALSAYYIGERRRAAGLPGSSESDWLEAERQLRG